MVDFSDSEFEDFVLYSEFEDFVLENSVLLAREDHRVGYHEARRLDDTEWVGLRHYIETSEIRIDVTIPEGSLFGPERDRYCCLLYEKAIRCGELLDPWHMWKKISPNSIECKYCRLSGNTEFIRHECGWWEDVRSIRGQVCFCYCFDNLGYVLMENERFVVCNWSEVFFPCSMIGGEMSWTFVIRRLK